jgi:CheY-like chemotaxis protein
MLTDPTTRPGASTTPRPLEVTRAARTRTIVIVNGDDRAVPLLDAVLESGHYDIVFIESTTHAYSQIKRVRPNLVVICTRLADPDGFQVLTMLKLDEHTRSIPVVACATDLEEVGSEDGRFGADPGVRDASSTRAGRLN